MFPRIFIIAHFFDLSRLLHKKAECGEGSDSISVTKEADDGNQNRNVRQKKSEAASGTTAHSLPPNGGEGSDSISVTKEAAQPQKRDARHNWSRFRETNPRIRLGKRTLSQ